MSNTPHTLPGSPLLTGALAILLTMMLAVILAVAGAPIARAQDHKSEGKPSLRSAYAGQEKRAIKSLSEADLEALRNGKGWGLAKAAELNGVPGPTHLLEMRREIGLSADQVARIQALFAAMKQEATRLGLRLIERERELNEAFASAGENGAPDETRLKSMLQAIAAVRMELRFTHLKTHLRTPPVLTPHQITLYNRLRGYGGESEMKPGNQMDHSGGHGKHQG